RCRNFSQPYPRTSNSCSASMFVPAVQRPHAPRNGPARSMPPAGPATARAMRKMAAGAGFARQSPPASAATPHAMTDLPDRLYAQARDAVAPFRFDEDVVRVFPDMIRRSVPGYATVVAMTGVVAARHAQPGSALYDL